MTKYWIAVASAEHARRGRDGFMQVNHGKKAPLQRIRAGDGVAYYPPAETIGGRDRLQSFTTIGRVRDEELYQGVMGGDFTPWRRNVDYVEAAEAPIAPLLERLEFTRGKANWGYQMRFGLFEIGERDFRTIATAMGAEV
jgi:hypothetical protein